MGAEEREQDEYFQIIVARDLLGVTFLICVLCQNGNGVEETMYGSSFQCYLCHKANWNETCSSINFKNMQLEVDRIYLS